MADDVAAAVRQLRGEQSISMSDAVNELVRAGLIERDRSATTFRQKSRDLGAGIDVDNIVDSLEKLDGPSGR